MAQLDIIGVGRLFAGWGKIFLIQLLFATVLCFEFGKWLQLQAVYIPTLIGVRIDGGSFMLFTALHSVKS